MPHIRKYLINNFTEERFQAVIEVGNTGKRKRKTKSFKRKMDARRWILKNLYE